MEIPKANGGTRPLGIPTVADRIAQDVARRYLEPVFHVDSYGYRPGKSAIDAVRTARQRCWRYDWVLDIDLRSYFDNVAGIRVSLPARTQGPGQLGDDCSGGRASSTSRYQYFLREQVAQFSSQQKLLYTSNCYAVLLNL